MSILHFSNIVTILQYYGYADQIYGVPIQNTRQRGENHHSVIKYGIYAGYYCEFINQMYDHGIVGKFQGGNNWTTEKYKVVNRSERCVSFNGNNSVMSLHTFNYFNSIAEQCDYNCEKMFKMYVQRAIDVAVQSNSATYVISPKYIDHCNCHQYHIQKRYLGEQQRSFSGVTIKLLNKDVY